MRGEKIHKLVDQFKTAVFDSGIVQIVFCTSSLHSDCLTEILVTSGKKNQGGSFFLSTSKYDYKDSFGRLNLRVRGYRVKSIEVV